MIVFIYNDLFGKYLVKYYLKDIFFYVGELLI